MDGTPKGGPSLALVEDVRCLGCETTYAKPAGPGTAAANPGCPECGYVGWIAATIPPISGAERPRRSAADPPRRRAARSG